MTLEMALPPTRALESVQPGVWQWSTYSDEKQLYFNGLAVRTPDGVILIDPPEADEATRDALRELGDIVLVMLTNGHHERASELCRDWFGCPVTVHELDIPILAYEPETTFSHGDKVMDTFEVVHLPHQKTPGESALWMEESRTLILGDALIGKPAGQLRMLPDDKYADVTAAKQGLQALAPYIEQAQVILVGDGESIHTQAGDALAEALKKLK